MILKFFALNDFPYIFLFEGPIDACFIKNGVGIAGINLSKGRDLTQEQEEQLSRYRFTHQFIWMLDSQHIDSTAREKTEILLKKTKVSLFGQKNLGYNIKTLMNIVLQIRPMKYRLTLS